MPIPRLPMLPPPRALKMGAEGHGGTSETLGKLKMGTEPPSSRKVLKSFAKDVEKGSERVSATAKNPKEQAKLRKACEDFESIFLNYLLTKMRESVPKNDLMGSDHGEDIYRGLMDEELTKQMAASGGVGLGSSLYKQLKDRI